MIEIVNDSMNIDQLLRSINLLYDADKPDRIAHFYPTSKSIVLLDSLYGNTADKAFFITAPYGSGKSLTATYLLQLVENNNDSKKILDSLLHRIASISPKLSAVFKKRLQTKKKGLVIALQGYHPNFAESLHEAVIASFKRLGIKQNTFLKKLVFTDANSAFNSLMQISEHADSLGIDRIVILWDEFGRHIEGLLEDGKPAEMNYLQTLAEMVSRTSSIPCTLGLFLHQTLMNYTGKSPQSIKREWKKIEGRFSVIQYIDDSKEIYVLISKVVSGIRPDIDDNTLKGSRQYLTNCVTAFHDHKMFLDFDNKELISLFEASFPLDPGVLFALPRISSRIAQHERTLFSFLNSVDLSKSVSLSDLYDYFSNTMSNDTGIGGTYHQWLESQSALSRAQSEEELLIIKSASILSMGMSGERARVSLELLKLASQGYTQAGNKIADSISTLITSKLLLYRKNTDSISVWHGADIDIAGRIEKEKQNLYSDFDFIDFLTNEIEPKYWKPISYNSRYRIQRYFRGLYLDLSRLEPFLQSINEEKALSPGEDAWIVYLFTFTEDEYEKAKRLILQQGNHKQIIWFIPRGNPTMHSVALEVKAFQVLQHDTSFIESDPLVLPELQQLADDTTKYLQHLIDKSTIPAPDGPEIIYRSNPLHCRSKYQFRNQLSDIMESIFPDTPVLNNEMIVRTRPRAQLVNARKKLLFGILDRAGEESLGLTGFTPDMSMFRTLCLQTGLYQQRDSGENGDTWEFVAPDKIKDLGLKRVWTFFSDFLTKPAKHKPFTDFFAKLQQPPYGIRDGVIPILFAAATRAFPSTITITDAKGEYLPDILPSTIEKICRKPEEFKLTVLKLDEKRKTFLNNIYSLFDPEQTTSLRERDSIRKCFDAIERWKVQLPVSALTTRQISDESKKFQALLTRVSDPTHLFFSRIPAVYNSTDIDTLFSIIKKAKKEIESVVDSYYKAAAKSFLGSVQVSSYELSALLPAAKKWVEFFPADITASMREGIEKAFFTRLRMPYKKPEALIDSICSLLVGKPIAHWEDSTITVFDREIHEIVNRIEEAALEEQSSSVNTAAKTGLSNLAVARIESLYQKLQQMVGEKDAKKALEKIVK